ncbi:MULTISPECIES: hypothetical protein [Haloferax]|uniref:Uncharacterized protein n=1 Tax=Haloferax marinum TaxID=2666143 RepID=A0A6A8G7T9_9EURY|nr:MULTISPECIES: hypothetical protein [Haloferax]KAB1197769.1 hypothetical protein Hfx1150_09625 [Haloferax sp. CBA1150]MRW96825.1 hypothetical protein [Haloferax marinum]
MAGQKREACGRCSMTTVVDATTTGDRDPLGDEKIELDESELRTVSPGAWFEGISTRLDNFAERVIYGNR